MSSFYGARSFETKNPICSSSPRRKNPRPENQARADQPKIPNHHSRTTLHENSQRLVLVSSRTKPHEKRHQNEVNRRTQYSLDLHRGETTHKWRKIGHSPATRHDSRVAYTNPGMLSTDRLKNVQNSPRTTCQTLNLQKTSYSGVAKSNKNSNKL